MFEETFKDDEPKKEGEKEEVVRPKSKFTAPMNRWNIQPGYKWDGKIRGTGFEQKWFN